MGGMMGRPQRVKGHTDLIQTGCGKLYVTISNKDEEYQELFCNMGKCGGCAPSFLDAIGRLISIALNEEKVTLATVKRALQGIRCPSPLYEGALSCVDAIAKAIENQEEKEDGLNSK
jgi:ribonucleoside-diphosphate reductase alpha chain